MDECFNVRNFCTQDVPDSGHSQDVSLLDAGDSIDSGTMIDSGPTVDSGPPRDGAFDDARASGGGRLSTADSGCGCAADGRAPVGVPLMLLLLGLFALTARSARRASTSVATSMVHHPASPTGMNLREKTHRPFVDRSARNR